MNLFWFGLAPAHRTNQESYCISTTVYTCTICKCYVRRELEAVMIIALLMTLLLTQTIGTHSCVLL